MNVQRFEISPKLQEMIDRGEVIDRQIRAPVAPGAPIQHSRRLAHHQRNNAEANLVVHVALIDVKDMKEGKALLK